MYGGCSASQRRESGLNFWGGSAWPGGLSGWAWQVAWQGGRRSTTRDVAAVSNTRERAEGAEWWGELRCEWGVN